jgi:hypothetical protein
MTEVNMMRTNGTMAILVAVAIGLMVSTAKASECEDRPLVQLAILLDTSNSMDGLIAQAKTELWRVVNELATAKRKGQRPRLEVALYEYGNSGLAASSGWIRKVTGFTTDLDRVSEALFGLTTNGGDEFCGQVIDVATRDLDWNGARGTLKVIFIAGNEPFTQGSVDFRKAVKRAVGEGIAVNTIHCGSESEGENGGWHEAARLGDGTYLAIDQNRAVAQINAPQDDEIRRLSEQMNRTYVAYGRSGGAGQARQKTQDAAAASMGASVAAERAVSKAVAAAPAASADWDLVSAQATGKGDVGSMAADDLPAEMRDMSREERKAHVDKLSKERADLQAKIEKLAAERRDFVAKKEAEQAAEGQATLGGAMIKAVRSQAEEAGFEFDR